MAAANVVLTQNDLRKELAREAGFGTTVSQWDTTQRDMLTTCMKRTARLMFQPPPLPNEPEGHSWSWLHPSTTMVLWPSYSTSADRTVTADGTTTITGADDTDFVQSMVGKTITIYTDADPPVLVGTRTVVSVNETNNTIVVNSSLAAGTYQWAMTADGTYRAPVDFIGIEGPLRHAAGVGRRALERRTEGAIGEMLAQSDTPTEPRYYAIRPVAGFDGDAEQAWEFYVAPIPATARTMHFAMHLNIDVITAFGGATEYVPGGSPYTELWRACGLMVVEQEVYRVFGGGREADYYKALTAAVMHDRRNFGPESAGRYGDPDPHRSTTRWMDPAYATTHGTPIYFNGNEV